jgi:hypothetical protein
LEDVGSFLRMEKEEGKGEGERDLLSLSIE